MSTITPFDSFNEMALFDRLADNVSQELKVSREFVHYANITNNFWEVLRDSINEQIKDGNINVYSLRPSEIRGQEDIYIKDEQIPHEELTQFLTNNFQRYVQNTFTGVAAQNAPFFFSEAQANLARISQAQPNFENLIDIDLFQIELIIFNDETGFGIKPTKLIFSTALYNTQFDYEINEFVEQFEPQLGFLIDLTEQQSVQMLSEMGIQFSGEYNMMSFYDLITLFHYDFRYFSVSNQGLRSNVTRFIDRYEIESLRESTKNYFNDLIFTFIYGQVPNWWSDNGRGGITNGLFEISETYREAVENAPEE
ncbi:MAG: hypothetical protein LAT67_05905 [Balneolales bacterium]|nr:hypothetical protein [Balneolales bacterium]